MDSIFANLSKGPSIKAKEFSGLKMGRFSGDFHANGAVIWRTLETGVGFANQV
jgi:hypothetical protein